MGETEPQKVKPIYPVQSFQHGMSEVSIRFLKKGQLYVETRSKACIFFHSTLRRWQGGICEILLGRQLLPISFPLLNRDSDYYLFARHANDGKVSKGETELQGYSDSLVIEVGLCHN